jgi:catechol 2,3-dioxygenase-like lactoylglutathione lyase family enzyme
MSEPRVKALHCVDLGVADLDAATAFFTDIWGLTLVAGDSTSSYLRGTGPFHHILALHRRPRSEILRINLLAADRTGVDALHAFAAELGAAHGITDLTELTDLDQPGGGYGFAFRDCEGRNLAIVADIATHTDTDDTPDRPRKLAHVVLNSEAPEQTVALFTDLLGFRVSDRTRMHNFFSVAATPLPALSIITTSPSATAVGRRSTTSPSRWRIWIPLCAAPADAANRAGRSNGALVGTGPATTSLPISSAPRIYLSNIPPRSSRSTTAIRPGRPTIGAGRI